MHNMELYELTLLVIFVWSVLGFWEIKVTPSYELDKYSQKQAAFALLKAGPLVWLLMLNVLIHEKLK